MAGVSFRVCLFKVAGERFGLRLETVSEIVPMAALSRRIPRWTR